MHKSISNTHDDDLVPTHQQWTEMGDGERVAYIHDSLLELYLNIKIRNFESVSGFVMFRPRIQLIVIR